jgi:hypothetical protein
VATRNYPTGAPTNGIQVTWPLERYWHNASAGDKSIISAIKNKYLCVDPRI